MSDGVFVRGKRFYISYIDSFGKRIKRVTQARTMQEARNIRAAELVRLEMERVTGVRRVGDDTFEDVTKRYLTYQKPRLSEAGYVRLEGIVERLRRHFTCKIAAIKRVDIQAYVTKRMDEVSVGSCIKELGTIKHILKLAHEWEVIAVNPAEHIKPPKASAGRIRYLQPQEWLQVFTELPAKYKPIAALAVTTGMRRGEILGLTSADIDWDGGRLFLRQTKNGDSRIVYLNQDSLNALRPLQSIQGKLWKFTPEQVSTAFTRACKRAGIDNFHLHDLRHTFGSWQAMKGTNMRTLADLLGHRDIRMTMRYSHLSPDHLGTAMERTQGIFDMSQLRLTEHSIDS